MRNRPGDGADQRSTRRHDQATDRNGQRGRRSAAGSVFAPGYDTNRPEPPDGAATGPRSSSPGTNWYGSAAGGAAGKGPVRGYPPVPGQPPPMYPPGQFTAWNRGRHGQGGPLASPGQADSAQPQTGRSDSGQAAWQTPPAAGAGTGTSRYYDRPDGPEAEPGYSMLAVSDPAADVTSTQTWHALGEGRATGVWTAPARPGAGPSRPGVPPARPSPDIGGPDGPAGGRRGSQAAASAIHARTDSSRAEGTRTRARAHSGARTGPQGATRADSPPRSRAQRASGQKSRGKRPASVKLAVTVAILFVMVAAATLGYVVLRSPAKPRPVAGPTQKVSPRATASTTPGPYVHMGWRASRSQRLTAAPLFPLTFKLRGHRVTRT